LVRKRSPRPKTPNPQSCQIPLLLFGILLPLEGQEHLLPFLSWRFFFPFEDFPFPFAASLFPGHRSPSLLRAVLGVGWIFSPFLSSFFVSPPIPPRLFPFFLATPQALSAFSSFPLLLCFCPFLSLRPRPLPFLFPPSLYSTPHFPPLAPQHASAFPSRRGFLYFYLFSLFLTFSFRSFP